MRGDDEIRLVAEEEVEHRAEHRRVAQAGAKVVGPQAGQSQQPLSPLFIGKHPAERG